MERKKSISVFTISSILILGVLSPAFSFEPAFATPVLYGIDGAAGNLDPELFIIDQTSGSAVSVGPIGVANLAGCGAMDAHPVTGVLWALCENDGIAVPADAGEPMLITINPTTGAGTKIADVTGSLFSAGFFRIFDMSFRNADNTLYVTASDPGGIAVGAELHTLTLAGFSTKTIPGDLFAPTISVGGNGIAFSPTDVLHHIDGISFSSLNQLTGAAAIIAGTTHTPTLNGPRDNAMDYEPGTGVLFSSTNDGAAGGGPNYLSTVDTGTGIVTQVGLTVSGLDAIAFLVTDENEIHAQWILQPPGVPGPGDIPPTEFEPDPSINTLDGHDPILNCDPIGPGSAPQFCKITLPNFIDPLLFKSIEIDVLFVGGAPPNIPVIVTCYDNPDNSNPIPGQLVSQSIDPQNDDILIIDFLCEPNPDWETIELEFPPFQQGPLVQSITVWTDSFDDAPIGGISIPIDQSALLLAGVQSISMWMIPVVIAGIGIGIFVIKRRN